MSGIVGVVHLDGRPAEPEAARRMGERLAHRGPDGLSVWHDKAAALGHVALRSTPESRHEVLPVASRPGGPVITADVRLDNRDELISRLSMEGTGDRPITDAEIILRAYEAWGVECPERLIGAFAFAIWDPSEDRLLLARDHTGVKPLVYHTAPGLFAFASEAKALFALPAVPREPDERQIAHHLLMPVQDVPEATHYKEIRALLPAHTLLASRGQVTTRCYWELDPTRELERRSDEAFAEEFRHHFMEAVRCRLRTDAPVASFLSGGLDSSAIACAAYMLRPDGDTEPHHTLSAYYDTVQKSDERKYIEVALAAHPFEPHGLRADLTNPLIDVRTILKHLDQPNPSANLYIHWSMYRIAQEHGVRVVLDGFDGDTTVSHGGGRPAELARTWHLLRLLREERALSRQHSYNWRRYYWRDVKTHALRPLLVRLGLMRGGARAPVSFLADPDWSGVLNPDFARRMDAHRASPEPVLNDTRRHHWHMLMRPLMFRTLEQLDRASAAWAVEPRYPFMDKRLIEYCLALPADQKLSGGWTRVVMRRGLKGVLPEAIRTRAGKANHAHGFRQGIVRFEGSRLESLYRDNPGGIDRYLSAEFLKRVGGSFASGGPGTLDKQVLWRALTLGLWLELEQEAAGSI